MKKIFTKQHRSDTNCYVQRRRPSVLNRMLNLSIAGGLLLFTACSDMDSEPEPVTAQINQSPTLTIVPAGEDLIRIEASSFDKTGGLYDRAAEDRGRFNITLRYVTPVTDRQREVFDQAAARWERIIIGDVPSLTPTTVPIPSAFSGFPPVAAVGETIDDIVIEVALANIDGPGRILGQAGPRFARTQDYLTLTGIMFFDVADLGLLETLNLFEEVIVHEMGHVLGIGTLWSYNRSLIAGTFAEPYFTGDMANTQWQAEGGTGFLPIENMGGRGTRFSHWRESVLNNELMTGFLNLGVNPLSRITAGSLRDLGYRTSVVGEHYELEKNAPGVDPEELENLVDGINIAEMEVILEPVGYVVTEE